VEASGSWVNSYVALKVEQLVEDRTNSAVSGVGELHLSLLIRKTCIVKGLKGCVTARSDYSVKINGNKEKPYEAVTLMLGRYASSLPWWKKWVHVAVNAKIMATRWQKVGVRLELYYSITWFNWASYPNFWRLLRNRLNYTAFLIHYAPLWSQHIW